MDVSSQYSHGELVEIYGEKGGKVFGDACDYVERLVPKTLFIDSGRYSHMACYYDAKNVLFYYIETLTGLERFLSREEITHYLTLKNEP